MSEQPVEMVSEVLPASEEKDASENVPAETPALQGEALLNIEPAGQKENPLHVKLDAYDGPLDLLLDLIKKNEMDIYNIPISEITRQYLEYLSRMKELDLEIAGEFIVMAATLIYIKSKMLLPQTEDVEDEDGMDPRAELVRKLLEYQAFKEAAKELSTLEDERGKVFTRQLSDYYLSTLDGEDTAIDAFSANLYDLLSAFHSVLAKMRPDAVHQVFEEITSIEDRTAELKSMLEKRKRFHFSELFSERWTRNFLIVTFLSILEMAKSRFILIRQDGHGGEIFIEKREDSNSISSSSQPMS